MLTSFIPPPLACTPPCSPAAILFTLAPLPNWLFSRCAGADDFSAEYSSGPVDFGHFLTSCFLVSGVALPYVLAHAEVIHQAAAWMSAAGGLIGYATSESFFERLCSCGRPAVPSKRDELTFALETLELTPLARLAVITYSHFFAIQLDEF